VKRLDRRAVVATFLTLGLDGATGLSSARFRRVRDVVWTVVGLIFWP
jgi:hypothetical protein